MGATLSHNLNALAQIVCTKLPNNLSLFCMQVEYQLFNTIYRIQNAISSFRAAPLVLV